MPPATFRDVIDLWPSRDGMRDDVQRAHAERVAPPVYSWATRSKIPPKWFDAVVEAARRRGFREVTFRLLSDIHRGRVAPAVPDQPLAHGDGHGEGAEE